MARIVQFPISPPAKLGHKKARKRRKKSLEDYGQLNIFDSAPDTTPVFLLPKNQSFFEEAIALDEQGNPDAERYYLLAIENHDSLSDAYCNLGILKANKEKHSEAINYLTKCLEVNPRHFEAHYNLGNIYSDLGNLSLAKVHYEIAIEIEPEYPNSHYNLALVMISLKEYREAIHHINKFVSFSPGSEHPIANELIKTLNAIAK